MRRLASHKVNGLNEAIQIEVLDGPGPGGACHEYGLSYLPGGDGHHDLVIKFQNGPISEAGVNGVSQEALLAIVEDRLAGFQTGGFATTDNADALDHVRAAMVCLKRRTLERVNRGVEGTSKK